MESAQQQQQVSLVHRIVFKSQSINEVLSFLGQRQLTEMQIVCREFYDRIIPFALQTFNLTSTVHPIFFEDKGKLYQLEVKWEEQGTRSTKWH